MVAGAADCGGAMVGAREEKGPKKKVELMPPLEAIENVEFVEKLRVGWARPLFEAFAIDSL